MATAINERKRMMIQLPYGRPDRISERVFLAAWQRWFSLFDPSCRDATLDVMPVRARNVTLADAFNAGHVFSLDVLLRMLVSNRDTRQATTTFRSLNAAILETKGILYWDPRTNRTVQGARLTDIARHGIKTLVDADYAIVDALLAADVEDADRERLLQVSGLNGAVVTSPPSPFRCAHAPAQVNISLASIATYLVDEIDKDPFQASYRGRPHGRSVVGWSDRHASYFWPSPGHGVGSARAALTPLIKSAQTLMQPVAAGQSWSTVQGTQAVTLANSIFAWGGVPQPPAKVTPAAVHAVFRSVLMGRRQAKAPMNSGWAKLAALASTGLSNELAIWDSRVAHSLIRRLDAWFFASALAALPQVVANVGHVPGRGGSRVGAAYMLNWPSGYGHWRAVFAGSQLVRAIRDELARRGSTVDGSAAWTVRDVEMVLFMDGY